MAQRARGLAGSDSLPALGSIYQGEIGIEPDLRNQNQRRFTEGPLHGPTLFQATIADAILTGKKRNEL